MAVIASVTSLGKSLPLWRLLHDPVVARRFWQPQGAAAQVVGGQQVAPGHAAGGLIRLDLPRRCLEAIGRMAQEDHAQHRHKIIAGSQLGVGTEVVRRLPEVSFEFFDVFEGVGHAMAAFSYS